MNTEYCVCCGDEIPEGRQTCPNCGKFPIIERNYQYFKDNFNEIVKNHIGEYVVIKDCTVVAYFKDIKSGIDYMLNKGDKLGKFIVQECKKEINL